MTDPRLRFVSPRFGAARHLSAFAFALSLAACSSSDTPSGDADAGAPCTSDDDCSAGQTCADGVCGGAGADAGDDTSATDAGTDPIGEDADGGAGEDTDSGGGDDADAGGDTIGEDTDRDTIGEDTDRDAIGEDTIGEDTIGDDADAGPSAPTLADYLPCDIDTDCPVGLGNCITEVSLNREDPVLGARVAVTDLLPDWPSEGICTLNCAADASVCAGLSLTDSRGRDVPYSCHMVVEGTPPYPVDAPAFPFDTELDPVAMQAGLAFGAVCRPPFGLNAAHSDAFCGACDGAADCGGDDVCWSFADGARTEVGGRCLEPCLEAADCPFGFACSELSEGAGDDAVVVGSFCAPVTDTCSDCRDLDGDRRGAGRCGPASAPVSAFDCDDLNADAYYAEANPQHAFPEFCGEFDYNCNGISDEAEQVGADVFPVEHCTACGDVCEGVEPNATRQCRTDVATSEPVCAVICDDPTAFADCTPEPGCETPVTDPTRLYYRDADGDGAGDPDDALFACDPSVVPDGYVANAADCNDEADTAYGAYEGVEAALEICDGLDNDCDESVDEDVALVGDACVSDFPGACEPGTFVCAGEDGIVCAPTILPGTQAEICDDIDNDCDGAIDEDIATVGDACVADAFGVCAAGAIACDGPGGLICAPGRPLPGVDLPDDEGIDSNCDGIDGNLANAIFVSPGGRVGAAGTRTDPARTLQEAFLLSFTAGRQFILDQGVYESTSTIDMNVFAAGIYGGYARGADNSWARVSDRPLFEITLGANVQNALGIDITTIGLDLRVENVDIVVQTLGTTGNNVTAVACDDCRRTTFRNVSIEAGSAPSGASGDIGSPGGSGAAGNAGATEATRGAGVAETCTGGNQVGGAGGAGGTPVSPSGAGVNGWGADGGRGGTPAAEVIGANGGDGVNATFARGAPGAANGGHASASGGSPSAGQLSSATRFTFVRDSGAVGPTGFHGSGGGGGGGGQTILTGSPVPSIRPGPGGSSGGGPGCGGGGGEGGGAGGSSVGLVLLTSNGVVLENVTVRAGNGGNGGSGGVGGVGGLGGAGAAGVNGTNNINRSGAGGSGSGGGGGGGGGGGAGGSSYAIVRDGSTGLGAGFTLITGTPGAGGMGGGGGTGGVHGDSTVTPLMSTNGPAGGNGANGEALQQKVL